MAWPDWVFLVIILATAVRGALCGLINEVFGLAGLVLALMLAAVLYAPLGRLFAFGVAGFDISGPIAFLVVFAAASFGLDRLAAFLTTLLDATIVGWLNHIGGAVFGLLKGVLISAAIVLAIHRLPSGEEFRREVSSGPVAGPVSFLAEPLASLIEALVPAAEDDSWWRPDLEETLGVHDGEWDLLNDTVGSN